LIFGGVHRIASVSARFRMASSRLMEAFAAPSSLRDFGVADDAITRHVHGAGVAEGRLEMMLPPGLDVADGFAIVDAVFPHEILDQLGDGHLLEPGRRVGVVRLAQALG